MRLDEALPGWDRRERHSIPCDAPPAAVMRPAEEVTWQEVPIFRGLIAMMPLGRPRFSEDEPVLALFTGAGFEVLVREDDELLVGGIERFCRSRPVVRLLSPDLTGFRKFDEPGCIKIGVDFRYRGGLLSTETRVCATDPRSRWLFSFYWLVIRGGSGLIRHVWLRAVRRRACLIDQAAT
jgi:hypothetical protein